MSVNIHEILLKIKRKQQSNPPAYHLLEKNQKFIGLEKEVIYHMVNHICTIRIQPVTLDL